MKDILAQVVIDCRDVLVGTFASLGVLYTLAMLGL